MGVLGINLTSALKERDQFPLKLYSAFCGSEARELSFKYTAVLDERYQSGEVNIPH